MTVIANWTSPAAAGTLDLASGAVLTEAVWDAMVSNFLYLGNTDGKVTQRSAFLASVTQSTTSASFVAVTGVTLPSITTVGGSSQMLWMSGAFTNTVLGAISALGYNVDGGGFTAMARWTQPVAAHGVQIAGVAPTSFSSGTHVIQLGWLTSAGTLATDSSVNLSMTLTEFRRS